MRRVTFAILGVALVALLPATAQAASFAPRSFVDRQLAGGEPFVLADQSHHTLVYTSHEGTTHLYEHGVFSPLPFGFNYRNQVNVWTSSDGGASWQPDSFNGFMADPTKSQGFSDPDLTQDEGGRIYNTGIDLVNDSLFSSNDGGKTFDRGTAQCHDGDRPWLAGGKKDQVFLATNTQENTISHQVFESDDGGNTCPPQGIPDQGTTPAGEDYVGDGKIFYDHRTGRLIEPVVFNKHSDDPTTTNPTDAVGVSTWKPGDSAFHPVVAANTTLYAHWPAIALDSAGNVYEVWDDNPSDPNNQSSCGNDAPLANSIKMAVSKDFGQTWSAPITVAHGARARVFWPWVTAGDAGKVSVVWYQSDKLVDEDCETSALSIGEAQTTNALASSPGFVTTNASNGPIHNSSVCQGGTACVAEQKDRRLGDFFTNAVDERGCVMIASGDTTQTDPISGQQLSTSLPIIIRQSSGPKLVGSGECSAPPAPRASSRGQCRDRTAPVSTLGTRGLRRSRRAIRLRGRSADVGCNATATEASRPGHVQQVFVSIAKVRGRHFCRFLNAKGRLERTRNCRRPTLLPAKGTTTWSFLIHARLPRGFYRAVARGVDASGNKERPAKRRNQIRFQVR